MNCRDFDMKSRLWLRIFRAIISLSILSAAIVPAIAQNTAAPQNSPGGKPGAALAAVVNNDELQKRYADLPIAKLATPHSADSHPDFSGVWINPFPATSEKSENGTVSFD